MTIEFAASQADAARNNSVPVDAAPLHELHARGTAAEKPRAPVGGVFKRGCDVASSALLLLLLSPLLAIICGLIVVETRGSPFFLQRRGGFRGKVFLVYKFRTMTVCDDGKAVEQARQNDGRVTRIGAFLRRTSLDELPQLFNVLKGDMSLIGPRPHAVAHDRRFLALDPRYRARWRARPGITGLAQVSGSRGLLETPEALQRRVDLDLHYIEHWSPLIDAWILLRTALLVLKDRHAY